MSDIDRVYRVPELYGYQEIYSGVNPDHEEFPRFQMKTIEGCRYTLNNDGK